MMDRSVSKFISDFSNKIFVNRILEGIYYTARPCINLQFGSRVKRKNIKGKNVIYSDLSIIIEDCFWRINDIKESKLIFSSLNPPKQLHLSDALCDHSVEKVIVYENGTLKVCLDRGVTITAESNNSTTDSISWYISLIDSWMITLTGDGYFHIE